MNLMDKMLYRTNETTTMSNVTFLPSGFGHIRTMIQTLAKKKQDWNIDILEKDDGRHVIFEDDLSIIVPYQYWNDFSTMFDDCLASGHVGLGKYLREAMDSEIDELKEELKPLLTEMFNSDSSRQLDRTVNQWRSRFGVKKYMPTNSLVRFEDKLRDIQKLTAKVLDVYGQDIGNLQLLLEALRNGDPLNSFQVFRQRDYVYGTRVYSESSRVPLILEATVDMAHMLTQSIVVEDSEVLDELQTIRGIKVVRNVVYPAGESFDPRFFRELQDAVQGPSEVPSNLDNDDEFDEGEEGPGRERQTRNYPRGVR